MEFQEKLIRILNPTYSLEVLKSNLLKKNFRGHLIRKEIINKIGRKQTVWVKAEEFPIPQELKFDFDYFNIAKRFKVDFPTFIATVKYFWANRDKLTNFLRKTNKPWLEGKDYTNKNKNLQVKRSSKRKYSIALLKFLQKIYGDEYDRGRYPNSESEESGKDEAGRTAADGDGRGPGIESVSRINARGYDFERYKADNIAIGRAKEQQFAKNNYIPQSLDGSLKQHQKDFVNLAIEKFNEGEKGSFNFDGTGAGKTRQALALAETYNQSKNKKVLIVTQNSTIIEDAFQKDSKSMGLGELNIPNDPSELSSDKANIIPYSQLHKFNKENFDLVIFDEAHNLKNESSEKSKLSLELINNSKNVCNFSATPLDKVDHLIYIAETLGLNHVQLAESMGYEYKKFKIKKDGVVSEEFRMVKDPSIPMEEVARRLNKFFTELTQKGLCTKREVPLTNLDLSISKSDLPQDFAEKYKVPIEAYTKMILDDDKKKGFALMQLNRIMERAKVAKTIEKVKESLAKGEQAVVFAESVKLSSVYKEYSYLDDGSKKLEKEHFIDGTMNLLGKELQKLGIEFGTVAGGKGSKSKSEKITQDIKDFQSGKLKVLIGTPKSGGTGISLDDVEGDKPRKMFILTPPFSAVEFIQDIGRVNRLTTKSKANAEIVTLNRSLTDEWATSIIANKVKALGASVQGDYAKIDIDELDSQSNIPPILENISKETTSKPKTNVTPVPPRLDHGILNLPLHKRGEGSIDAQLDRYRKAKEKEDRKMRKQVSKEFKENKLNAKQLFNENGNKMIQFYSEKMKFDKEQTKNFRNNLESYTKWQPTKFLKVYDKFLKDSSSPTNIFKSIVLKFINENNDDINEIIKARPVKYKYKVPTGNPKRPFLYFYNDKEYNSYLKARKAVTKTIKDIKNQTPHTPKPIASTTIKTDISQSKEVNNQAPKFELQQESISPSNKKGISSEPNLFGVTEQTERKFLNQSFQPKFNPSREIMNISDLVTEVKSTLLKEGLEKRASEWIDTTYSTNSTMTNVLNLAYKYVLISGEVANKIRKQIIKSSAKDTKSKLLDPNARKQTLSAEGKNPEIEAPRLNALEKKELETPSVDLPVDPKFDEANSLLSNDEKKALVDKGWSFGKTISIAPNKDIIDRSYGSNDWFVVDEKKKLKGSIFKSQREAINAWRKIYDSPLPENSQKPGDWMYSKDSILRQPLLSQEEFGKWFYNEPTFRKLMIETLITRDRQGKVKLDRNGLPIPSKNISIKDIYNEWYLRNHIGSKDNNALSLAMLGNQNAKGKHDVNKNAKVESLIQKTKENYIQLLPLLREKIGSNNESGKSFLSGYDEIASIDTLSKVRDRVLEELSHYVQSYQEKLNDAEKSILMGTGKKSEKDKIRKIFNHYLSELNKFNQAELTGERGYKFLNIKSHQEDLDYNQNFISLNAIESLLKDFDITEKKFPELKHRSVYNLISILDKGLRLIDVNKKIDQTYEELKEIKYGTDIGQETPELKKQIEAKQKEYRNLLSTRDSIQGFHELSDLEKVFLQRMGVENPPDQIPTNDKKEEIENAINDQKEETKKKTNNSRSLLKNAFQPGKILFRGEDEGRVIVREAFVKDDELFYIVSPAKIKGASRIDDFKDSRESVEARELRSAPELDSSRIDEIIKSVTPETRIKANKELVGTKDKNITKYDWARLSVDKDYSPKISNFTFFDGNTETLLDYSGMDPSDIMPYDSKMGLADLPKPKWMPEFNAQRLSYRLPYVDIEINGERKFLCRLNTLTPVYKDDYPDGVRRVVRVDANFTNYVFTQEQIISIETYYLNKAKELHKIYKEKIKNREDMDSEIRKYFKKPIPLSVAKMNYDHYDLLALRLFGTKGFLKTEQRSKLWDHWRNLAEEMKYREIDLRLGFLDAYEGSTYEKGKETSYGDSGTVSNILDSHGVLVKMQNGKQVDLKSLKDIESSLSQVYSAFGDRSSMAKNFGLKISHSGERRMHASKFIGIFSPDWKAIGVSFADPSHSSITVAHEFAHFMDFYLGQTTKTKSIENKKTDFRSLNYASCGYGIENEIAQTFRKGITSEFKAKEYWARSTECFARALECYFTKKMSLPHDDRNGANPKQDYYEKEVFPLIEKFFTEKQDLLKSFFGNLQINRKEEIMNRIVKQALDDIRKNKIAS